MTKVFLNSYYQNSVLIQVQFILRCSRVPTITVPNYDRQKKLGKIGDHLLFLIGENGTWRCMNISIHIICFVFELTEQFRQCSSVGDTGMVKEECVFFLLVVYLGYLQHRFCATNEPPSKKSTFQENSVGQ
jgi:hypothetical protein